MQQKCNTEPRSFPADEPPERFRSVGVTVFVDVQVAFNRNSDARMAETLARDFYWNACLRAKACVSIAEPVQRDRRNARPLNAVQNCPSEVPGVN